MANRPSRREALALKLKEDTAKSIETLFSAEEQNAFKDQQAAAKAMRVRASYSDVIDFDPTAIGTANRAQLEDLFRAAANRSGKLALIIAKTLDEISHRSLWENEVDENGEVVLTDGGPKRSKYATEDEYFAELFLTANMAPRTLLNYKAVGRILREYEPFLRRIGFNEESGITKVNYIPRLHELLTRGEATEETLREVIAGSAISVEDFLTKPKVAPPTPPRVVSPDPETVHVVEAQGDKVIMDGVTMLTMEKADAGMASTVQRAVQAEASARGVGAAPVVIAPESREEEVILTNSIQEIREIVRQGGYPVVFALQDKSKRNELIRVIEREYHKLLASGR